MNNIKLVQGFDKYITIAGFRNVRIRDVNCLLNTTREKIKESYVQYFDAEVIAGWEHLFFAALNALKAFESKTNISKSLPLETLLFASAQRQITKAVELLGITRESSQVVALIIAESRQGAIETLENVSKLIPGERDDSVYEFSDEKSETVRNLFLISDLELSSKLKGAGFEREALIDLVIERIALLAIQR